MHTIYKITNKKTGDFYIGKTSRTVEARFAHHIQDAFTYNKYLFHKAIVRFGISAFKYEIIDVCVTPQFASYLELKYIRNLKPAYNDKSGFKAENRWLVASKIALASKGRKPWNFGKTGVYTKEQLEKFSRAKKGKPGVKWTEERRVIQAKSNVQCRKVIEVNSGVIYNSVSEVSRSLPISKSAVKMILNGSIKQPRNYFFKYVQN